jgi:hypothetical protein
MRKRLCVSLLAALGTLGALVPATAAAKVPANRGAVRFCPAFGTLTLRPGEMCTAPARHQVTFVDSAVPYGYAAGGYGLCVGVVNPLTNKFVSAPPGRNPRCSHTNYVSNYLGDLFGGLSGSPAVLNASAVTLRVQSSFSSRYPY